MNTTTTSRTRLALVAALALVVLAAVLLVGMTGASAQATSTTRRAATSTTSSRAATTTTARRTSSTAASTRSTRSSATTTSTRRGATTSSMATSTSAVVASPGSSLPSLLVAGPDNTVVTENTVAEQRMSTSTALQLVIVGLVLVALALLGLTYAYWRHTKPVAVEEPPARFDDEPWGGQGRHEVVDATQQYDLRQGPGPETRRAEAVEPERSVSRWGYERR